MLELEGVLVYILNKNKLLHACMNRDPNLIKSWLKETCYVLPFNTIASEC